MYVIIRYYKCLRKTVKVILLVLILFVVLNVGIEVDVFSGKGKKPWYCIAIFTTAECPSLGLDWPTPNHTKYFTEGQEIHCHNYDLFRNFVRYFDMLKCSEKYLAKSAECVVM